MALWKPFLGNRASLDSVEKHAGYVYWCADDGSLFFDYTDADGSLQRKQINAKDCETVLGLTLEQIQHSISWNNLLDKPELVELATDLETQGKAADAKLTGDAIANLISSTTIDHNESIIGLSVDGQTITYIKGDGSVHTFETQDTNTTYSLGTDEITGLTKLYATTGSAEDGTMTQKAIKTELDKKVGVSVDDSSGVLIFTI